MTALPDGLLPKIETREIVFEAERTLLNGALLSDASSSKE